MAGKDPTHTLLAPVARVLSILEAKDQAYRFIDVRSPVEYEQGSIPGAVNIPLFDEEERSLIGTLYRRSGKELAISKGVGVAEKKLEQLLESFRPLQGEKLAICCARGGMRSRSVANMLSRVGYHACQLEGGYKSYRHWVLRHLDDFSPKLIVLHGLTGVGKTRLLNRLDNAIDLEELAGHRSSLFGALGTEPSTQKTFESRLVETICSLAGGPYFIEGESRKIGKVFIPKPLAMAMKSGTLVYLHCSLETRIRRIAEDYPVESEEKAATVERILRSMKYNIGSGQVEELCYHLRRRDLESLIRSLLLDYYDRRYAKVMRDYRYSLQISTEDLDQAAADLTAFRLALVRRL